MKKTIITLAIVGTVLTIMAFTNSDNKSVGAIGDVKYSVLPPDKFKEENGNGWVLMDNNIPLQGSDLNTKHGITSLPDARGVFIRSLNLNRNDDKADPFAKENNNRQRLVGEFQDYALQQHTHSTETNYQNSGNGQPYRLTGEDGQGWNNWVGRVTFSGVEGAQTSGNETRPKNIALYTYIKIND